MTAIHLRLPLSRSTIVTTIPLKQNRQTQFSSAMKEKSTKQFLSPTLRKLSHSSSTRLRLLVSIICISFFLLFIHASFSSQLLTSSNTIHFHTNDVIQSLKYWRQPKFARERLRIYIYDIPSQHNQKLVENSIKHPGPIRDPRCDTNFYSSEVHVHRYLLNSPVRTLNADQADFFYVPIYTTCDLITHQPNDVKRVGNNFQKALDIIINDYPYWNRSNGRDHVYLFAQGFAARLAGNWHRIKNGIFMVHNGEFTADEYSVHKDFTIPPELGAYLKPYWLESDISLNIKSKKYLAQFGGQVISSKVNDHRGSNYSGGVRQFIQSQLTNHSDYRITGVRSETYLEDMKNSKFCLAPEGWHPWSPRPYYAVLMACIPVIISEVQELAFEEFIDWNEFVIWIRPKDIYQIDTILRTFPDIDLIRRQTAMKQIWQSLWYGQKGLANEAILHALYTRKYSSMPRRQFSHVS